MLEQTKNQLVELKLFGILKSLDLRMEESISNSWGNTDFLSALVTDEKSYRDFNKIKKRLKSANFRTNANMEAIDYTARRSLTKSLVKDLMRLNFVKTSPRNLLIIGPTGVGKTYLATAIGDHACRQGYTTIFIGVSVFCEKLMMARADGTYLKLRDRLIKVDLLIIDDVGLKKLPPEIIQDLHDLLEERQDKCTAITTQLPLKNWGEIIEDPLALDTIVDKLKHGSLEVEITGDSYRKVKGQQEKFDKQNMP